MSENIVKHEDALGFIFGGNALFTVKNTKTENRFTFKVTKHKKDDIFFVKVLTGPGKYEFIGSLKKGFKFKYSDKSRISIGAQSVRVFDYLIIRLITKSLPDIIEIWHNGYCGRCGRILTVPESISTGFGPECIKLKNFKINE